MEHEIILKSESYLFKSRVRKTKAQFFKDVEVGDWFKLEYTLKDPGHGRGLYASEIKIVRLSDGLSGSFSPTMMENYLTGYRKIFEIAPLSSLVDWEKAKKVLLEEDTQGIKPGDLH